MSEDRKLVETFLESRDELAFRALYRRHTPYLYALARRLSADAADEAEDLVEDAWLRALRALPDFEWRSQLKTWLAGIVVNVHRERVRAPGRTNLSLSPATEPETSDPDVGAAVDLEAALARLADGYREVVVLYHVYGYKHREIADLLGIDVGTSKSQVARGLARLRETLGNVSNVSAR